MKKYLLLLTCLLLTPQFFPQGESGQDSVEIYLIDNFVTPEKPATLIVSFSTSKAVKSELIIEDKYKYKSSNELSENHQDSINISELTAGNMADNVTDSGGFFSSVRIIA